MKRFFGWLLALVGAFGGIVGLGMVVAPETGKERGDGVGVIFVAAAIAVPGLVLLLLARRQREEAERREALLGFLRARRRVKLGDVAQHMAMAPFQAQLAVGRLVGSGAIDLVYSQATDEYLHRDAIDGPEAQVISRCATCGASVGQQLVLPGEQPCCPYCGAGLLGGERPGNAA